MRGGARSAKQGCIDFKSKTHITNYFYPCFWWKDKDKELFEEYRDIEHSVAYTVYGFKRTGCAGCPYNSNYKNDLSILQVYEPNLAKAVNIIFKEVYVYTDKYKKGNENEKQRTTEHACSKSFNPFFS